MLPHFKSPWWYKTHDEIDYTGIMYRYKKYGDNITWRWSNDVKNPIKLKDMSNDLIKKTICEISKNTTIETESYYGIWIRIFSDVLMNRRKTKTIRLLKIIKETNNVV